MIATATSEYKSKVLARFEGDEELLREVVQIFLEDSPQSLATLRHAVSERNTTVIHKTAHTLKGSVGNFLATRREDDPAQRTATAALTLERLGDAGQCGQLDAALAVLETELDHLQRSLSEFLTD